MERERKEGGRERVRCNDGDDAGAWDRILAHHTQTLILPFCFHVSHFFIIFIFSSFWFCCEKNRVAAFSFFKILN